MCLSPHSLDPLVCVPCSTHSTLLHLTEAHGGPGGRGAVPLLHSERPQSFTLCGFPQELGPRQDGTILASQCWGQPLAPALPLPLSHLHTARARAPAHRAHRLRGALRTIASLVLLP